jgi:hypothetical protein
MFEAAVTSTKGRGGDGGEVVDGPATEEAEPPPSSALQATSNVVSDAASVRMTGAFKRPTRK